MTISTWWHFLKSTFVGVILASILSSCSLVPPNEAETVYVKDCKTVMANFEKYAKVQERFDELDVLSQERDWEFWSADSVFLIEGRESRSAATASISKNYPWVLVVVDQGMADTSKKDYLTKHPDDWSDLLVDQLHEGFFDQLSKGTNFRLDLSVLKNIVEKNESYVVDGLAFYDYLSTLAPTDRYKSCDAAMGLDGEKSLRNLVQKIGINGETGPAIGQVSQVAVGLWGCKTFGVGPVNYDPYVAECPGEDWKYSSVSACTGNLKITVNTSEYGDCGKLRFEVFQADANTGDCMALGWWNDKNGNQHVGAFMFCGLEEGYTYNEKVSVGRETTYTNNFGIESTVVTFLDAS